MIKTLNDKLDEVLGCLMLTTICLSDMVLGYDSGISMACVAGIIALLTTIAVKKGDS